MSVKSIAKGIKTGMFAFLAALMLFSTAFSTRAYADDTMQVALKNSIYGGIIGALIGSAAVLVTDNPDDHLNYIPTGAGIGIMLGAAYGVASSGVVQSLGSIENGKFSWSIPTISIDGIFDRNANHTEVVRSIDVVRLKF